MLDVLIGPRRKPLTEGMFAFNAISLTVLQHVDLSVCLNSVALSTASPLALSVGINSTSLSLTNELLVSKTGVTGLCLNICRKKE